MGEEKNRKKTRKNYRSSFVACYLDQGRSHVDRLSSTNNMKTNKGNIRNISSETNCKRYDLK